MGRNRNRRRSIRRRSRRRNKRGRSKKRRRTMKCVHVLSPHPGSFTILNSVVRLVRLCSPCLFALLFVRTVFVRRVFVAIYGMHLHCCNRPSIPTDSTRLRPLSMAGVVWQPRTDEPRPRVTSLTRRKTRTAKHHTYVTEPTYVDVSIYVCIYVCICMYKYVFSCVLFLVHRLQRAIIVGRVKTRSSKLRSNKRTEHSYVHAPRAPDER